MAKVASYYPHAPTVGRQCSQAMDPFSTQFMDPSTDSMSVPMMMLRDGTTPSTNALVAEFILSWHLSLSSRDSCHLDNPHILRCY